MRIIAGTHRGRPLLSPPGRTTRPITDRVKESLFAILAQHIPDSHVADLFAGSGSLGIEALSRGAHSCLFVESAPPAVEVIRRNLQQLDLRDQGLIRKKNAWQFSKWAVNLGPFDLIFLDPPYADSRDSSPAGRLGLLLSNLSQSELLNDQGLIVLRHQTAYPCQEKYEKLALQQSRTYGSMALSFLIRPENI